MRMDKNKKLVVVYAGYVLVAAIISMLAVGFKYQLLMGLIIGSFAALVNYFLLAFTIRTILGRIKILGVQFFILRYLIYLFTAYVSVRIGNSAAVMYAVGVIGLSVAIFITYGIGGMKEQ